MRGLRRGGFSIVELLVAVAVVVMVMVAIVSGVSVAVRNSRYSKEKATSVRQAQEAMEWLRSVRGLLGWRALREAVNEDGGGSGAVVYCLDTLPGVSEFRNLANSAVGCGEGVFVSNSINLREMTLELDPGREELRVTVTVKWEGGSGEQLTRLVSTMEEWR